MTTHRLKDGSTLAIREATPDDAAAILEFVHAISRESEFLSMGPGDFELSEAEEVQFLQVYQQTDNHVYLTAWVGETLAGTIMFAGGSRPRVRHTGELGISVRKAFWSLGVGGHLLDALIDWARQSGIITKVNLRVRPDNDRAIHLYERKGFRREGAISREVRVHGRYYEHVWMGLEL